MEEIRSIIRLYNLQKRHRLFQKDSYQSSKQLELFYQTHKMEEQQIFQARTDLSELAMRSWLSGSR